MSAMTHLLRFTLNSSILSSMLFTFGFPKQVSIRLKKSVTSTYKISVVNWIVCKFGFLKVE